MFQQCICAVVIIINWHYLISLEVILLNGALESTS
jgi:hypothetical protein